jgi:hypothetical protein
MRIKRTIAAGVAALGFGVGSVAVLAPAEASASTGSCVPVSVSNSAGKFTGWKCQDSTGTSVGGQLKDTNSGDGKCVVLAVTFVHDGTLSTQPACYGPWPTWTGEASSYDVISIEVRTA